MSLHGVCPDSIRRVLRETFGTRISLYSSRAWLEVYISNEAPPRLDGRCLVLAPSIDNTAELLTHLWRTPRGQPWWTGEPGTAEGNEETTPKVAREVAATTRRLWAAWLATEALKTVAEGL